MQQSSWSYVWGPQGLEYANKNSGALTQNFTTDPRGRILSMTYTSATYSGELYFHYDALGNTSLITDANSNPKASFQYDLHTGRLIQSWNPSNLEILNLNDGITGSINLTAIRAPGLGKDITIQPWPPVKIGGSNGGDWGSVDVYVGGNFAGVQVEVTHPDFGKDIKSFAIRIEIPGIGPIIIHTTIKVLCDDLKKNNGKMPKEWEEWVDSQIKGGRMTEEDAKKLRDATLDCCYCYGGDVAGNHIGSWPESEGGKFPVVRCQLDISDPTNPSIWIFPGG